MAVFACAWATAACSPAAPPGSLFQPEFVQLRTDDGVELGATLYRATPEAPAGLVIAATPGAEAQTWQPFAQAAQRRGAFTIVADLRGHGRSATQPDGVLSYRDFDTENWYDTLADIDAAKAYLLEQGAHPGHLALAGAGIGANLVLNYAALHSDIQAAVLVSPGLEHHGVTVRPALGAYGPRPLMLLTSQGDTFSATACRTLESEAEGYVELREYPGAAHGTGLFASAPASIEHILAWLDDIVGPRAREALGAEQEQASPGRDW